METQEGPKYMDKKVNSEYTGILYFPFLNIASYIIYVWYLWKVLPWMAQDPPILFVCEGCQTGALPIPASVLFMCF
jgi:hypothetical protein